MSFDSVSRALLVPTHTAEVCETALDFCRKGDFRAAEQAMSDVWPGLCRRPFVAELPLPQQAELLYLAGVLTGRLGRARGIEGATEAAKDLFTEAQIIFAEIGDSDGVGRVLSEMGYWCLRERAYGDAHIYLTEAFARLSANNSIDRAETVIRLVMLSARQQRDDAALNLLNEHADLIAGSANPSTLCAARITVAAAFCFKLYVAPCALNAFAALAELKLARELADNLQRDDYFFLIGNNSAHALAFLGRYDEAHASLDGAFEAAERAGNADARINMTETRARVLMAEGRYREAQDLIAANLAATNEAEQRGLLAESLLCAGEIAIQLRGIEEARTSLLRSVEAAQHVGDTTTARRAEAQLERISNVAAFAAPQFTVRMDTDALEEAGLFKGEYYYFRRSRNWKEGDIVAVNTPDCSLVAYIFDSPPSCVRLEWAGKRDSLTYLKTVVTVVGILEVE